MERRPLCARGDVGRRTWRPPLAENPDEPLGNLFLAGEAAHETLWGTVNGAWESGERAADSALRRIGASKEPEQPSASKRKPSQHHRRTPARRANDAFGFPLPQ